MSEPVNSQSEPEFAAFVSFSGYDNKTWRDTFKQHLTHYLRVANTEIYYSEQDPVLAGTLDDELKRRLARSRVLVSLIGEGYLQSKWCELELKTFFDTHSDAKKRFIAVFRDEAVFTKIDDWR